MDQLLLSDIQLFLAAATVHKSLAMLVIHAYLVHKYPGSLQRRRAPNTRISQDKKERKKGHRFSRVCANSRLMRGGGGWLVELSCGNYFFFAFLKEFTYYLAYYWL